MSLTNVYNRQNVYTGVKNVTNMIKIKRGTRKKQKLRKNR